MSDIDTTPMKRRCPHNDLLTEAFGISGRNGRVGVLEQKVKTLGHLEDLGGEWGSY
jgi:hypothetical protein